MNLGLNPVPSVF